VSPITNIGEVDISRAIISHTMGWPILRPGREENRLARASCRGTQEALLCISRVMEHYLTESKVKREGSRLEN
jgi:hypothetical protein